MLEVDGEVVLVSAGCGQIETEEVAVRHVVDRKLVKLKAACGTEVR